MDGQQYKRGSTAMREMQCIDRSGFATFDLFYSVIQPTLLTTRNMTVSNSDTHHLLIIGEWERSRRLYCIAQGTSSVRIDPGCFQTDRGQDTRTRGGHGIG